MTEKTAAESFVVPDMELARRFLKEKGPPHEVLLCGITGAHIYGFPSPDSDIDMKGMHIVPTAHLLTLHPETPAYDRLEDFEGTECDLTTQEIARSLAGLLKGDGNVLERILSPYQLIDSDLVDELQEMAIRGVHQGYAKHYRGYLKGMQREHDLKRRAKTALYSYRVALTGAHLLRTGELQTDVRPLAEESGYDAVDELVRLKANEHERVEIPEDLDRVMRRDWERLEKDVEDALEATPLPETAPNVAEIEAWLLELRKERLESA